MASESTPLLGYRGVQPQPPPAPDAGVLCDRGEEAYDAGDIVGAIDLWWEASQKGCAHATLQLFYLSQHPTMLKERPKAAKRLESLYRKQLKKQKRLEALGMKQFYK